MFKKIGAAFHSAKEAMTPHSEEDQAFSDLGDNSIRSNLRRVVAGDGDLQEVFEFSLRNGDSLTNVDVGAAGFPGASQDGLPADLLARVLETLGSASVPNPFLNVGEDDPIESLHHPWWEAWKRWKWESGAIDRMMGKDAPLSEVVGPWSTLSPRDTTALKFALERGEDERTLHRVLAEDMRRDLGARASFLKRLRGSGAEAVALNSGKRVLTIINTDVDDTVFPSLWDRGRYERHSAYPGVREMLHAQGNFLVILTARPSLDAMVRKTRDKFKQFLELADHPPSRVNLSVAPGTVENILSTVGMGLAKAQRLMDQRALFSEAISVFNGDSGQGDWLAALLLREVDPEGFAYATIHDVRPWSTPHRLELLAGIADHPDLRSIVKMHLENNELPSDDAAVHTIMAKFYADVCCALPFGTDEKPGETGRLNKAFLRSRKIFLFRTHADLALDLHAEGLLSRDAARGVIAAAAPKLRFTGPNKFKYDAEERVTLTERIAAFLAEH